MCNWWCFVANSDFLRFTLFYIKICCVAIYALLLLAKNCACGEKWTNMYEVCSSSLLSHQLLATISLALGGLVRRKADPEADADPHRFSSLVSPFSKISQNCLVCLMRRHKIVAFCTSPPCQKADPESEADLYRFFSPSYCPHCLSRKLEAPIGFTKPPGDMATTVAITVPATTGPATAATIRDTTTTTTITIDQTPRLGTSSH